MGDVDEDNRTYSVVVNDEGQYSIWLAGRPLPAGWTEAGHTGGKDECLDHIGEVWTDMRPSSLRQAMDAREGVDRN
ncbi:MbtH family protein [Actinophytocola gossypii]|uniref:MbtH family protein n=1 Tax=Actinophytocola gossypii TaxID=2812003 RepID=UPI0021A2B5E1|nr:MbtH family NRPS accessory protein [Actinophytocola gossypii]